MYINCIKIEYVSIKCMSSVLGVSSMSCWFDFFFVAIFAKVSMCILWVEFFGLILSYIQEVYILINISQNSIWYFSYYFATFYDET